MTQAFNLSQFANNLNSSGQVSAAGLQAGVTLASGTVGLYYQSSAPTGWAQVTSLNDYALRIVSSSGGTTGGTTAFSTVFANQSLAFTGTVGATTLSSTQMPAHQHISGGAWNWGCYRYGSVTAPSQALATVCGFGTYGAYNSSVGGGGSHSHTFSAGSTSDVVLNVRYANIILCSKN